MRQRLDLGVVQVVVPAVQCVVVVVVLLLVVARLSLALGAVSASHSSHRLLSPT